MIGYATIVWFGNLSSVLAVGLSLNKHAYQNNVSNMHARFRQVSKIKGKICNIETKVVLCIINRDAVYDVKNRNNSSRHWGERCKNIQFNVHVLCLDAMNGKRVRGHSFVLRITDISMHGPGVWVALTKKSNRDLSLEIPGSKQNDNSKIFNLMVYHTRAVSLYTCYAPFHDS